MLCHHNFFPLQEIIMVRISQKIKKHQVSQPSMFVKFARYSGRTFESAKAQGRTFGQWLGDSVNW